MTERPGSLEARRMYKSSLSLEEWEECVAKYSLAVKSVASGKSKSDLVEWDHQLWYGLVSDVNSRNPKHINLFELANVMKWKLSRGKARPLQKLVESNSPASVIACSTDAFQHLEKGHWEKAIESITSLKAVGVATATAILAPFAPALIPFMADEVMEAVSIKRDYTMKIYKEMRTLLIMKATELQEIAADSDQTYAKEWTAELVGKALWVKAMMTIYPELSLASDPSDPSISDLQFADKGIKKRKNVETVQSQGVSTEVSTEETESEQVTKKGRTSARHLKSGK